MWLLLIACQGGPDAEEGEEKKADPATLVEVETASPGHIAGVLVTTATVESAREADVVPLSGGTIVKVLVEEGDAVTDGQVLALIDNAMLDGAADRAKSEVERIAAQVATLRELHGQGAVSDKELADAEFALKSATAASREAGRNQAQTRLVAPFDGVVALRNVREGQYAPPGVAAFRVVDPNDLHVVTSLPERDLSRVREGQAATVISAYDAARTARAAVTRVAPVVDAGTGTFRATLDLAEATLKPGQFVTVQLEVEQKDGVLTVPREALVYEDGAPYLFRVVDPPPPKADEKPEDGAAEGLAALWAKLGLDGKPEAPADAKPEDAAPAKVSQRVPVALGLGDPQRVEVTEGLAAGDAVIVVGQTNLRDGAPVKLK